MVQKSLLVRLDDDQGNEFVFDEEERLTWQVVAIASGAGEARYNSRSQTQAASVNKKGKRPCEPSTSFRLIDEEDEFEFEGKNHNTKADEFNVDHVEDEDSNLEMTLLLICFFTFAGLVSFHCYV